ncbi:tyrosine-protein kinase STYK1 [Esox lucius]|uniref:Protein kinase domain-containing protein n=1 Tax=Esox lucius TaxID=8010 RepID=A0A3P8ZGW1_ESOLU|nr:tyrosine-protein kinase STYK1 [Esox lucius]
MDVQESECNNTSDPLCYEEGSGSLAVIIIPALLTFSTVVTVTSILCILCQIRKASPERSSSPAYHTNQAGDVGQSTSPVGPWEIPGDCTLEGLEFCRTGHYGPVCSGTLRREHSRTAVVVKTLGGCSDPSVAKEFVDWILFHGVVCKHQNLVRMLCCQTQQLPMCLVLEAFSPGNLLHYLWTLRNRDSKFLDQLQHFSERSVYLVAKQVAAGLEYLLSEHRIVHGNVAARNILIGSGLSVKVSGLGLAFEVRQGLTGMLATRRTTEVPLKWQAPERMMKQPTTDRSDVFSFGIVLYELITLGSPPYPDLEPPCVLSQLQKSYRMKRPEHCGGSLYDLMKYCWMWSFKDRPAFSAIIKLLESYTRLADTKDICIPEAMNISDYSKRAGVLP